MRATAIRPRITRLSATEAGAELELACGSCGHVFLSHQHLVCGLPIGYHVCTGCGLSAELVPELYEAALHTFMPVRAANSVGFPNLRFASQSPAHVTKNTNKRGGKLTIVFAPAHSTTHGKFHGELARRSIALHRRLMILADSLGQQVEIKLRPDPEERARRNAIVDENRLREVFTTWAIYSGCPAPVFVDGTIEDELANADLLITHVGAPWIEAALAAGIEVMVLPLLLGAEGERSSTGALAVRDSQLDDTVQDWIERYTPETPTITPEPAGGDNSSLRILCAYRDDLDGDGGAAIVMNETKKGLEDRGHHVDVTYEIDPDTTGYDVVHCFNVWQPASAMAQIKNVHKRGVPIVWSPIFLDLSQLLWAGPFLMHMSQAPKSELPELWRRFETGFGLLGDYSCWGPNEIEEGFFKQVAEALELVDHVCVTSTSEVKALMQRCGAASFPFSVVPHGVRAKPFKQADANLFEETFGLSDFVLCVGTVERRKNQLMIAEALKNEGMDIVFIGPCFENDYLNVIGNYQKSGVHILGRQSQEMVASALKAAAVHILPSFAEGAALANLEAAVAECPMVVSNRSSELEYFSDGVYYCDPLNRESIRSAVKRAIAERESRAAARRILAQRTEVLCDWNRTAELTEAIYFSHVATRA